MPIPYKKSKSGYYLVELSKVHRRRGFAYKPGPPIRVKEDLLEEMNAAGAVASVASA